MAEETIKAKELDKYELIEMLTNMCDECAGRSKENEWLSSQIEKFRNQIKQLILERKND